MESTAPGFEIDFLAYSDSTTPQISGSEITDPSFVDGADLYTVTSGGNDIGFSGILIACVYDPVGPCNGRIQRAKNVIDGDGFRNDLKSLYSTLKQEASMRSANQAWSSLYHMSASSTQVPAQPAASSVAALQSALAHARL